MMGGREGRCTIIAYDGRKVGKVICLMIITHSFCPSAKPVSFVLMEELQLFKYAYIYLQKINSFVR